MKWFSKTTSVDISAGQETSVVHGSTISFHGINYFVCSGMKCCYSCCCTNPKYILRDVSGIFRPGMNAIMGPSGCGKTTLLNILAGCCQTADVTGTILIDGQRCPKNFKFMTGYVVQDDVVMGTLTVRENLMFSANLRLPESLSQKNKRQRVDETIQELGLTSCADTKVGTHFVRGVSGGERKRLHIGMELIIRPSVLFLDEPTTGLDSSTASAVMSLLHRLSKRGRTVIFSIHQPRMTIFGLFDRLSVLGGGRCIFHGPAPEVLLFFQSIGYTNTDSSSLPDFVLDVVNGDSAAIQSQQDTENEANAVVSAAAGQMTENDRLTSVTESLSAKFSASTWAKKMREELQPLIAVIGSTRQSDVKDNTPSDPYVTSFLTQLRYVSKRTFVTSIRNPETLLLQLVLAIAFALLIGVIYLQLDDAFPAGLQNRTGSLFLIVTYHMFINVTALEVFIQERVIFIHETASGYYRVSAYFFSKIFCDFIPMRFIPLCPFSAIAYFMIGYQIDAFKVIMFGVTLYLTTIASAAVCFAIGATIPVFSVANLLSSFTFIVMMIFGGLLVNITSLDDWLSWLQYVSFTRFSLNALLINELDGMTFYGVPVNGTMPHTRFGSDYLTDQGIDHDTLWDYWHNTMALCLMATGFLFIAYVQLRQIEKLK